MSIWNNDPLAQYERQMIKVNYLVLNEINRDKNVDIDMEDLNKILEVLHDYGIIN